jgi:DNA-binding response OmpR family regulator
LILPGGAIILTSTQGGGMPRKVLIVEDESSVRELLSEILKINGFTVLTAEDGKKGLDEAKKNVPNIIVLDVNMPKMDGFQVLEYLKKDRKTRDIPVIMLTTRASQDDIAQGMQLYADKYIPKPFDSNYLVTEIKKTLDVRGI